MSGQPCEYCVGSGRDRPMLARRRCPSCRRALCNPHSKAATTMRDYAANVGRRICTPCGGKFLVAAWGQVE